MPEKILLAAPHRRGQWMPDAVSAAAMKTALDRALELYEYGLAPIPIVPDTKRPAVHIKPFFEQGPSPRQFPILFREPVEVAVPCGQPSDRLVILDCDNTRSAQRRLSLLGDPATWLVRTARGLHIYLRTPVAVKSARGDGYDLQPQSKYCLAPGSRHPQGMFYEFVRRTPHILELPALDAVPELELEPARLRPSQVPRRAWHLLTDENAWQARYASRSEAEFAILIALANTGHTHVWAVLSSSPQAVTTPALAEATGRGNRTVERALERMRALGMVRHDPGENGVVWSTVNGVNLEEIAGKLGTSGMGVRQRAEHARQRENHRIRIGRRERFCVA